MNKWTWTSSHEYEGILNNIPCHIVENSQYICLPCGNNIWCGKIFHALSWHILPHHMRDLLGNQQWFIDSIVNIIVNNSIMWRFKIKIKYKDAYYHFWCNECSKYRRFLYNTFNIFRIVEMTTNNMLEKYLMNLNL
jgi:hypothetical protein